MTYKSSLLSDTFKCWMSESKHYKGFSIQDYLGLLNTNYSESNTPWYSDCAKTIINGVNLIFKKQSINCLHHLGVIVTSYKLTSQDINIIQTKLNRPIYFSKNNHNFIQCCDDSFEVNGNDWLVFNSIQNKEVELIANTKIL